MADRLRSDVTNVTSGVGAYVEVTGTVAQASNAFGVAFADYTDSSGQTARAPVAAATVPIRLPARCWRSQVSTPPVTR